MQEQWDKRDNDLTATGKYGELYRDEKFSLGSFLAMLRIVFSKSKKRII